MLCFLFFSKSHVSCYFLTHIRNTCIGFAVTSRVQDISTRKLLSFKKFVLFKADLVLSRLADSEGTVGAAGSKLEKKQRGNEQSCSPQTLP